MTPVAVRELRNNTRQVVERVQAGESIVITVGGRPAIELRPVSSRPRFLGKVAFVERVLAQQADPGLAADLAALVPDTTDDLDL